MGELAGTASAVYGTVFFSFGAFLGSLISQSMHHGVFPLVISFFILGMVALVLVFTDKTVILLKEGSAEKPESE